MKETRDPPRLKLEAEGPLKDALSALESGAPSTESMARMSEQLSPLFQTPPPAYGVASLIKLGALVVGSRRAHGFCGLRGTARRRACARCRTELRRRSAQRRWRRSLRPQALPRPHRLRPRLNSAIPQRSMSRSARLRIPRAARSARPTSPGRFERKARLRVRGASATACDTAGTRGLGRARAAGTGDERRADRHRRCRRPRHARAGCVRAACARRSGAAAQGARAREERSARGIATRRRARTTLPRGHARAGAAAGGELLRALSREREARARLQAFRTRFPDSIDLRRMEPPR